MSKIYPNLDFDERRYSNHSDTKCAQIFTKSTAITKDILERFDEDLGPKKASVCGRNFNARQLWVLCGLFVLFFTSCFGIGLMFGTKTFHSFVLSNLILTDNPDSPSYRLWKGPIVKTFIKVYIFNYTNVEEYEKGDADKLHVEEVGPYVYEEMTERINIKFLANGTVSYQDKKTHQYRPDLSGNRLQNETVRVPNLPLFGAAAIGKEYLYPLRLVLSGILNQLDAKPFIDVPVDQYIWGYDDIFYAVARSAFSLYKKLPFEKFGILASRKGVLEDVYSIHTGLNDINKLKQLDTFNGKNYLSHWATDQCNLVKGSDGTAFSLFDVQQKKPISVFNKEMCHSIKLIYDKDVKMFNGKLSAARYILPTSTFDTPESNPDNACYCNEETEECSPHGVFNIATCNFGAPAIVSFPYFVGASEQIQHGVSGLDKVRQVKETYVNVHPIYGFSMSGRFNMQINVQVQKSFGMQQLDMFEDNLILPMAWIEIGVDEMDLPDIVISTMYKLGVTVPAIELCLKYGSILGAIVTSLSIFIILRGKWVLHE